MLPSSTFMHHVHFMTCMSFFMLKVTQDNLLFLIDYSDDEGEDSPKENEEPEEWGKFLHLKERVSYVQHTILLFTQNLNLSSSCLTYFRDANFWGQCTRV